MTRLLLVCVTLAFMCTDAAAASREIKKRASIIEKQFDHLQRRERSWCERTSPPPGAPANLRWS